MRTRVVTFMSNMHVHLYVVIDCLRRAERLAPMKDSQEDLLLASPLLQQI